MTGRVTRGVNPMAAMGGADRGGAVEGAGDFGQLLSRKEMDAAFQAAGAAAQGLADAAAQTAGTAAQGAAAAVPQASSSRSGTDAAAREEAGAGIRKEAKDVQEAEEAAQDAPEKAQAYERRGAVKISRAEDAQKGITAETEEGFGEWKRKIAQALMEKLNVSEEELLQAMELLGIGFENLLTGQGVLALSMELTGAEDATELLFDSGFRELMQELELFSGQLAEAAGMSPEELQKALQQAMGAQGNVTQDLEAMQDPVEQGAQAAEQPDIFQSAANLPDGVEQTAEQAQGQTARQASELAQAQPAQKEAVAEQPQEDVADADEAGTAEAQGWKETSKAEAQAQQDADLADGDGQGAEDRPKEGVKAQQQGRTDVREHSQVSITTTVQSIATPTGEETVQTIQRTFVDVQDIIRQVSEFTRVTVTQEASRLELQLNPEHLGKLYVQLTSRNGVITAQLAAQNEAVKQALESQAAILREDLNSQGLKVEAVEVTVASHEFEQQFQEGQQMGQRQEEAGSQGQRRFLNLSQISELDGLTEEESLAARMMADSGNSVDMTA